MCGVAEAALGVAIVGALAGGAGMVMEGEAAARQASIQRANAEYNAQAQEMQATDAERRGVAARETILRNMRLSNAELNNGFSPFVERSGSATDLLLDNTVQYAIDAEMSDYNYKSEAWGYRVGAQNSRNQGELASASAPSTGMTLLGAGGTVATGVGGALGSYSKVPGKVTTDSGYTSRRVQIAGVSGR